MTSFSVSTAEPKEIEAGVWLNRLVIGRNSISNLEGMTKIQKGW